ncbi:MAG: hypothetical protein M3463_17185 [Verrucomicrobiota bacterium]|nr:hypothetical protein [Verrucomicrobiota bacterium]
MGILKPFSRTQKPLRLERLPAGCFSVHRGGGLVASTLPSVFSQATVLEIGRVVTEIFNKGQTLNLALSDLYIHYSGLTITAREMRGGALIFLSPATLHFARTPPPPAMHYKNIEEFVLHLENYIECWKQFNQYVNLGRDKKFSRDDEIQFLEVKSIIAQGLEAITASAEKSGPRKEEVNALFANAPSLRYLSEMPDAALSVESQWHKIYLSLQSLLGQLKVQHNKQDKGAGWSLFSGKK